MIIKSINASSGRDNFLVHNPQEFSDIIAKNSDAKFVAQPFIPNDGDLRVVVMGDEVSCVYRRVRQDGDHRNNVSQGGDKIYLPLDEVDNGHQQLAVQAARAVNREICGVDVMINSQTGQAVVLEANFNFGIRAQPGVISDELYGLAEYLHKKAVSE